MRVLDSLHENGAKLVQMPPEAAAALRAEQPGLRLAPLVHYRKADAPRPKILEQFRTAARTTARAARGPQVGRLKLKMLIQGTTLPAVGADVLVFTNYANRVGAEGKSNKRGEVTLALGPDPVRVQKLFIYPASGCWSLLKQNISLASGQQFHSAPARFVLHRRASPFPRQCTSQRRPRCQSCRRGQWSEPASRRSDGGRRTLHRGRRNTTEYGDVGDSHGTHVAGIIAARGTAPDGLRGLAPAVLLYSYRVFGRNSEDASYFRHPKGAGRRPRRQMRSHQLEPDLRPDG